jgi:hypothetical protein
MADIYSLPGGKIALVPGGTRRSVEHIGSRVLAPSLRFLYAPPPQSPAKFNAHREQVSRLT